jgi:hypothetical protein
VPPSEQPAGAATWVLVRLASGLADRVTGVALGLLRRSGFAEVADPVVVSVVADSGSGVAGATAEPTSAGRHGAHWQWSAGMRGAERALARRHVQAVTFVAGGQPTASLLRIGFLGIGIGPPQILLVLRPSCAHNAWCS